MSDSDPDALERPDNDPFPHLSFYDEKEHWVQRAMLGLAASPLIVDMHASGDLTEPMIRLLTAYGNELYRIYELADKEWCIKYLAGRFGARDKTNAAVCQMHVRMEKVHPLFIPLYMDLSANMLIRMGRQFTRMNGSPFEGNRMLRWDGAELILDDDGNLTEVPGAEMETRTLSGLPMNFERDLKARLDSLRDQFVHSRLAEQTEDDSIDEADDSFMEDDDPDELATLVDGIERDRYWTKGEGTLIEVFFDQGKQYFFTKDRIPVNDVWDSSGQPVKVNADGVIVTDPWREHDEGVRLEVARITDEESRDDPMIERIREVENKRRAREASARYSKEPAAELERQIREQVGMSGPAAKRVRFDDGEEHSEPVEPPGSRDFSVTGQFRRLGADDIQSSDRVMPEDSQPSPRTEVLPPDSKGWKADLDRVDPPSGEKTKVLEGRRPEPGSDPNHRSPTKTSVSFDSKAPQGAKGEEDGKINGNNQDAPAAAVASKEDNVQTKISLLPGNWDEEDFVLDPDGEVVQHPLSDLLDEQGNELMELSGDRNFVYNVHGEQCPVLMLRESAETSDPKFFKVFKQDSAILREGQQPQTDQEDEDTKVPGPLTVITCDEFAHAEPHAESFEVNLNSIVGLSGETITGSDENNFVDAQGNRLNVAVLRDSYDEADQIYVTLKREKDMPASSEPPFDGNENDEIDPNLTSDPNLKSHAPGELDEEDDEYGANYGLGDEDDDESGEDFLAELERHAMEEEAQQAAASDVVEVTGIPGSPEKPDDQIQPAPELDIRTVSDEEAEDARRGAEAAAILGGDDASYEDDDEGEGAVPEPEQTHEPETPNTTGAEGGDNDPSAGASPNEVSEGDNDMTADGLGLEGVGNTPPPDNNLPSGGEPNTIRLLINLGDNQCREEDIDLNDRTFVVVGKGGDGHASRVARLNDEQTLAMTTDDGESPMVLIKLGRMADATTMMGQAGASFSLAEAVLSSSDNEVVGFPVNSDGARRLRERCSRPQTQPPPPEPVMLTVKRARRTPDGLIDPSVPMGNPVNKDASTLVGFDGERVIDQNDETQRLVVNDGAGNSIEVLMVRSMQNPEEVWVHALYEHPARNAASANVNWKLLAGAALGLVLLMALLIGQPWAAAGKLPGDDVAKNDGDGKNDNGGNNNPPAPQPSPPTQPPPAPVALRPWAPTDESRAAYQRLKNDPKVPWRVLRNEDLLNPQQLVRLGYLNANDVANVMTDPGAQQRIRTAMRAVLDIKSVSANSDVRRVNVGSEYTGRVLWSSRQAAATNNAADVVHNQRVGYVVFELVNDPNLTRDNPYRFSGQGVPFPAIDLRPTPDGNGLQFMYVIGGFKHPDAPAQPPAYWTQYEVPDISH